MTSKFIISRVVIEQSPRDIEIGVSREFSDGFNLITGNNEKGKSSLMNFIKEGLFKTKGSENGKIFFKIQKNNEVFNYRADIKQSKLLQAQRLEIIDENTNINIDDSLIKNIIDETYFKQGFAINLDDLMIAKTKDNEAFISAIKDPCADKLRAFCDKSEQEILKVLTDKKKPNKDTKKDIEQINKLNLEIKELSKKENEYNDVIRELRLIDTSIKELSKKQQELETYKKILFLNNEIQELESQSRDLERVFNQKLFENKEQYFDIIEAKSAYEGNIENIEKNNLKIQSLQEAIVSYKSELKNSYFIEYDIDSVLKISFDYDKNKKIREIIEKINKLKEEIKANELKKSLLQEDIFKLKIKKDTLKPSKEPEDNNLVLLNSQLQEGLELARLLTCEIEKNEAFSKAKVFDKKSIYIFALILLTSIIMSAFGLYLKSLLVFFLSFFIFIAAFLGIVSFKNTKNNKDIENKQVKRKETLDKLKKLVSSTYPQILDVSEFELLIKLENIKRDILDKIKEQEIYKKDIEQNEAQIKEKEAIILNLDNKNNENRELIEKYNLEGVGLIDKNLYFSGFELEDFEKIFEIIKLLKDNLEQKTLIEKENEDLKNQNKHFIETFKNFIFQNNIKMALSSESWDNLSAFIASLKECVLKNDELKSQLDFKNKEIELKKNQAQKYKKEISLDDCNINLDNIEDRISEIAIEKEIKQNEKEQALVAKNALENFEGITKILFQKQREVYKYQNKIKNLFINYSVLLLSKKAKENFDKNQPDLVSAQKYLSYLTDNKYSKINLDLKEISSEDCSITKNWQDLSRGTKEQLYFALKLAYASNYSKDRNTLEYGIRPDLPFIVDDAFVNFDEKRTKNALKCLFDFSKTNQVLFFTCHNDLILKYIQEINCEDKINKVVLE